MLWVRLVIRVLFGILEMPCLLGFLVWGLGPPRPPTPG